MKRLIAILLFIVPFGNAQQTNFATLRITTANVGTINLVTPIFPSDDFEAYGDGAAVHGLTLGYNWNGPFVDHYPGIQSSDDFESYADAAAVNALNGGAGWNSDYSDRRNINGLWSSDDMESYADGATVNTLNGGTDWNGAFVAR